MMHNDVSSPKKTSLNQAWSLNVELGLDFDFISSKKLNQSLDGPLIFTPLKLQFSWPFSISSLGWAWAPTHHYIVRNSIGYVDV